MIMEIGLLNTGNGIISLGMESAKIVKIIFGQFPDPLPVSDHPVMNTAIAQLEEYFSGKRTEFSFAIQLVGTPFECRVWRALAQVPYGKAITYQQLSILAGHPNADRAVGTALKKNPLPLVIPCHRVVRKDHSIGQFQGGSSWKQALLDLERRPR
jgi:methylated-DNA-[protein]-cysteine S-methyltransferase